MSDSEAGQAMIEYRQITIPGISRAYAVYLNSRRVGHIECRPDGWCYTPKGDDPGRLYSTLNAVKRSLEG